MISNTKRVLLAGTSFFAIMLAAPAYADLVQSAGTTTSSTTLTGASGSSLVTLSSTAIVAMPTVAAPGTGATAITVTGDANPVTISTFGSSSITAGLGGSAGLNSSTAGGNGGLAISMAGTGTSLINETVLQNSSTSISGGSGGIGGTLTTGAGNGGNGGNGGVAISSSATYTHINLLTGGILAGTSGAGGGAGPSGGNGGNGGNGATAIILTGANSTVSEAAGTNITGSAGSAGGAGVSATDGNGGNGGIGISLTATNGTLTIAGTVTGGAGGLGGGTAGNGGSGNDAIHIGSTSTGINIAVTGTITGGAGGNGATGSVGGIGGAGIYVGDLGSGNTGTLTINNATINGGQLGGSTTLYRPALDFSGNTGNMNVSFNGATVRGLLLSNSTTAGGDVLTFNGNNTIDSEIYTSKGNTAYNGTLNVMTGVTNVTLAIGQTGAGALTAINVQGTSTLSGGDGIYSSVLNFTGDGTVNMTNNGTQILLGAVTTTGGTNGLGTINSQNSSGTDTFNNTVGTSANYLKALNITGTGTTTALSSVFIHAINFTADGSFLASSAASNSTIGVVTTSADGTGSVVSGNTSGTNTFASVGAQGAALKSFSANAGGTGVTTVGGGLYAAAVSIGNGNTLNVGGGTSGTVDATANNVGILNYNGTGGIIAGDIGSLHALSAINFGGISTPANLIMMGNAAATTSTIATGSVLNIGANNKTVTGNLINNGTLNLGNNTITVTGNLTGNNSTIGTTIGLTSNGNIINVLNSVNPTFTSSLTINTAINGGGVGNGQSIVVVHAASGHSAVALPPTSITVTGAPILINWKASTATVAGTDMFGNAINPNDIILTASVVNPTINGLNSASAPGINSLLNYTGNNSNVRSLLSDVENLSAAGLNKAGAQLAPETNAAGQTVAFGTVQKALGTIAARNDSVRFAQAKKSGVSSGEALDGYGFWVQGFGLTGRQSTTDGVDGYTSTTFGTAFGGDSRISKNVRVGASMSFAKSTVNQDGVLDGSSLKVDSYIGSLYGSYTGKPWYVDGNLLFGLQNNHSYRLIDFGSSAQTANGVYGSQEYGFDIGAGYPIALAQSTTMAPVASFLYTHLNQNSYTETGAPGADLSVNANSTDSFVSATGLKFASFLGSTGGWSITPNARLIWLHEFNNKAADEVSSFVAAGGSSFITPGLKIPADTGEMGLGIDFASNTSWTLSAKYDLQIRQAFIGNGGMFQIRKDF